jgi:protoheme IX farnesyltransferase
VAAIGKAVSAPNGALTPECGVAIDTPRMRSASVSAPLATATAHVRDLVLLAKPRLSTLVVVTSAGGLALAPGQIGRARAILTVLGTAAVVGAANALNCYLEREIDGRMRRTRDRPLPAGRVEPFTALALGVMVPAFSLPVLALVANPLTALLAFVALVTYVVVYTPMKQRSTLALFVGAVPGAIPPLMGWTAVTGRVDPGGLALFALLFAWQLPHFLAVSLYLREDYARGGLKVFSIVHGEPRTRLAIAASTVLLVPVSLLLVPLGVAGAVYGALAAALGLGLAALAIAGLGKEGGAWARTFFLATLVYLTVLFVALLAGA